MSSYLDPISIEDVPIVEKVCKECGESDVEIHGCSSHWSVARQEWVVIGIHNPGHSERVWCATCDDYSWTTDVTLDGESRIFRG